MKILFQGDSITDAFRKPEEINTAYQLGNGYAFLVSARLAFEYPGRDWAFWNRGVSGNRVEDLAERWERDALAFPADVVSVLVGVNNTIRMMNRGIGVGDEEFIQVYDRLLGSLRARNPEVKLVLLEPFLLEVGRVTPEWRAHLRPRQVGIQRLAVKYGAIFVPLQSLFDEALLRASAEFWSFDGIHPTAAGFELISRFWLSFSAEILQLKPLMSASEVLGRG